MNKQTVAPYARGTADSHIQKYRPDIDGLRAIAVTSVILYHVDAAIIPGGYLGVDVFFVISGFLITSIIRREQESGAFLLGKFYERRIRRIMPALLFVLIATLVAAIVLLLPTDLVGFGKSLLSTIFFGANIYFFLDTNYFAAAAEQKPLLHMWSLGVEEQFYLFFPLLLMLLRFRRVALPIITALVILSLMGNMAALYFGKANPAFFLIPFRAWELGIGAILAIYLSQSGPTTPKPIAASAGATILVLALIGINLLKPFSVPIAFFAVFGTALLIYAHHAGLTWVGQLLALRLCVLVGLLSYSLYLWHWPMIVLPMYYLVRELTLLEGGLAIVASIAMSTLSWRYVERPFRQSSMSKRNVYSTAFGATLLIIFVAILIVFSKGLPSRLETRVAEINSAVGTNYRCPVTSYLPFGALYACPIALTDRKPDGADTVLFGNSHAQMYVPAVKSALQKRGRQGLLVPANGCLPSVDVNISVDCNRIMHLNLLAIENLASARVVIIAFNWDLEINLVNNNGALLKGDHASLIAAGVERVIDRLAAAGKAVILVGPIAIPGYDISSVISRKLAFGHRIDEPFSIAEADFQETHSALLSKLRTFKHVTLALPHLIQCRDGRCYFIDDGEPIFADSGHIASKAAKRFTPMFERALAEEESGSDQ